MRHLVLGTAGHIDHGKTALVRALTGEDTDRLPEEKRRGITIDLGFARLPLPDAEYAVVDVPGHESLVRNMLAGATGIDVVLLVVAADEGVMPQTREHLAIMELLAVRQAVIAVTKTDLVAGDWLELVCDDLRSELAHSAFAAAPMVPVSAITGEGLDQLRDELAAAARQCQPRSADDLFRLPIDRVFTVRGTGTVVTGTVWSGQVHSDATLRALPGDFPVRARGLQRHGAAAVQARAGERIALAVAVGRTDLQRGTTLVNHDAWQLARALTVELFLLPDAHPLKARQRVRLHLGTAETLARVALFGAPGLAPGERAWSQLRLEAPIVARAGDRFVLRSYSPVRTIAGGIVAEPLAPKRKRLDGATAARLDTIVRGDARAAALVHLAGTNGVLRLLLPLLTGLSPNLADRLGSDVYLAGDRLYASALADDLRLRILVAVQAAHRDRPLEPGASREELRRAAGNAPLPLLDHVLRELVASGSLVPHAASYALPGFQPSLTPEQEQAANSLIRVAAAAGLAAPKYSELPPALSARADLPAIVRHLAGQGRLILLAHEQLADPEAVRKAAATLRAAFAEHPRQSASRLKEVLGLTRKHLIPLLEFFDQAGVTRRDGDDRLLGAGGEKALGEGG